MADYEEIKKIEDKRIQMFVKLKRKNRVSNCSCKTNYLIAKNNIKTIDKKKKQFCVIA